MTILTEFLYLQEMNQWECQNSISVYTLFTSADFVEKLLFNNVHLVNFGKAPAKHQTLVKITKMPCIIRSWVLLKRNFFC